MVLKENSPWGTMKTVRPTKIVIKMFDEGHDLTYIKNKLKEKYLLSDTKIDLTIKVAREEMALLENVDYKNGYSLYIGIPFCPSICAYCTFSSTPIDKDKEMVEQYVLALISEIEYSSKLFKGKSITSIYMGGGTPTSISANQLDRILGKIFEQFNILPNTEFTIEAGRPDSITREKLETIKKYNINRISINPQSMKQETLDIIGRKHKVPEVEKAYNLARELGFDNINMDIIIGLPGETKSDVEATLKKIQEFNPDSFTVHSLAIKRAADLTTKKSEFTEYQFENSEEVMELTYLYAEKMNMNPYYMYRQKNMVGNMENIGYAKNGKAGLYNILIMEEIQSILALGAGAITKVVTPEGKITRIDNVKNVEHYINRIEEMKKRKSGL